MYREPSLRLCRYRSLMSTPESHLRTDAFEPLKRRKFLILGLSVLGAVGGFLSVYLGPKSYEARAALVFNIEQRQNNPLAAFAAAGPNPVELVSGVLKSRSAEDLIVKRTGISRKDLRDWLVIQTDVPANQLIITMSYQPNKKALEVIQASIQALSELDERIVFSNRRRKMNSLLQAIKDNRVEQKRAQERLIVYQKGMKSMVAGEPTREGVNYLLAAQTIKRQLRQKEYELGAARSQLADARKRAKMSAEATLEFPVGVPQIAEWRLQLTGKQHELDLLSASLGPEAPEIVRVQQEIKALTQTLRNEVKKYISSVNSGVVPEVGELEATVLLLQWQVDYLRPLADTAPTEAAELSRLSDEVSTLTEVGRQIRIQYETAKAEALSDPSRWSVLDEPSLDVLPSNYRPTRTAGIYGLVTLVFSSLAILFFSKPSKRSAGDQR